MNYLPFFKRRFEGKTIEKNGYVYQFRDISINEDNAYIFKINTITPIKDGGYLLPKIYEDIHNIISSFIDYLSVKNIPIYLHYFVNGEDVHESYIPFDSIVKIAQRVTLNIGNRDYELEGGNILLSLQFAPNRKFQNSYEVTDDVIAIYLGYNVRRILIDGVLHKPAKFGPASSFIQNLIWEDDNITEELDDISYQELEPQLQIRLNENFYYHTSVSMKAIMGKRTESRNYQFSSENWRELFEPI